MKSCCLFNSYINYSLAGNSLLILRFFFISPQSNSPLPSRNPSHGTCCSALGLCFLLQTSPWYLLKERIVGKIKLRIIFFSVHFLLKKRVHNLLFIDFIRRQRIVLRHFIRCRRIKNVFYFCSIK